MFFLIKYKITIVNVIDNCNFITVSVLGQNRIAAILKKIR